MRLGKDTLPVRPWQNEKASDNPEESIEVIGEKSGRTFIPVILSKGI